MSFFRSWCGCRQQRQTPYHNPGAPPLDIPGPLPSSSSSVGLAAFQRRRQYVITFPFSVWISEFFGFFLGGEEGGI